MSGFYFSDSMIIDEKKTNKYLKNRGKHKKFIGKIKQFSYIYNVYSPENNVELEFSNDECVVFFDGVIFSSADSGFNGTIEYILSMYKKYGVHFTRKLDGEYVVCIIDFTKNIIIISKDVFGTKPLWFSKNCGVNISTYKSSLISNGHNYSIAEANTTYVLDFFGKQIDKFEIMSFDLNQYKNTYNDWCDAFDKAIKKRMLNEKKVGLGLSSGYDSGAIFCSLINNDNHFVSVSFAGSETMDILNERITLYDNASLHYYNENEFLCTLKELYRNCEPFEEEYFNLLKDEASTGLGIICKTLRKENVNVYFSGLGVEGIMLIDCHLNGKNIYEIDGSTFGIFPEDLMTIFPWKNFFGSSQSLFLEREEYVCGCYGIQATYPFLDPVVVQEFLWLSAELKNKSYKAPIEEYFKKHRFPYRAEKVGFFVRNNEEYIGG